MLKGCERCSGDLCLTPEEVTTTEAYCLQCGYADYTYIPPGGNGNSHSPLPFTVARYGGDSPWLRDRVVNVWVRDGAPDPSEAHLAAYGQWLRPTCPFCGDVMNARLYEYRFKLAAVHRPQFSCALKHIIYLKELKEGAYLWQ